MRSMIVLWLGVALLALTAMSASAEVLTFSPTTATFTPSSGMCISCNTDVLGSPISLRCFQQTCVPGKHGPANTWREHSCLPRPHSWGRGLGVDTIVEAARKVRALQQNPRPLSRTPLAFGIPSSARKAQLRTGGAFRAIPQVVVDPRYQNQTVHRNGGFTYFSLDFSLRNWYKRIVQPEF